MDVTQSNIYPCHFLDSAEVNELGGCMISINIILISELITRTSPVTGNNYGRVYTMDQNL